MQTARARQHPSIPHHTRAAPVRANNSRSAKTITSPHERKKAVDALLTLEKQQGVTVSRNALFCLVLLTGIELVTY